MARYHMKRLGHNPGCEYSYNGVWKDIQSGSKWSSPLETLPELDGIELPRTTYKTREKLV